MSVATVLRKAWDTTPAFPSRRISRGEPGGCCWDGVKVMTTEQMLDLEQAMDPQWETLVIPGARAGLRQGEALGGVTRDRIDFLRLQLRIDRQLMNLPRQPRIRCGEDADVRAHHPAASGSRRRYGSTPEQRQSGGPAYRWRSPTTPCGTTTPAC